LVVLLTPLFTLARVRSEPVVPAAAGAYLAFLAHLAVDWDWQLTGVAATGLICGAAILVAGARDPAPVSAPTKRVLAAAAVAGSVLAFGILAGNLFVARASQSAAAGDWSASARSARQARFWMPWSARPWQLVGEAQLGLDERQAAITSFDHALATNPDDWSLWFDLARTATGSVRGRALRRAARLNPLSPEVAELRQELAGQGVIGVASP
jgi:hypothetical protein